MADILIDIDSGDFQFSNNGYNYYSYNNYTTGPGSVRNGQSDTWKIKLVEGNPDEFAIGTPMWFDGDATKWYSTNLDSWVFYLPAGWSMSVLDTTDHTGRPSTYWNLYRDDGMKINVGKELWTAGTPDRVSWVNVCFTHGTRLLCEDGELRAVEEIEEGDLVMTKDAGLQPVKWAGHSPVSRETLEQFPNRRPIVFEPGAVGNIERLRVSPQHRMLVTGAMDGGPAEERLVPAKHLVNDHNIYVDNSCEPVRYYHIMMDEHQIVKSEGAWSESFWPGAYIRDAMDPMAWSQVEFYFPELATNKNPEEAYGKPAREFLKRKHVEVFLNQDVAR